MPARDPTYEFSRSLVASLAVLGLRHVFISPGSRSTPLALSFADHPSVTDHSVIDERAAGFHALGAAAATRAPAAVVSTSGTAAAEYLPAVVEADLGRVPLLVLTADRPPELRHTGSPQTIDQEHLFGRRVRWYHDAGRPTEGETGFAPGLALQAWAEAVGPPAGPVHLNLPFPEPLVPAAATPPPGVPDLGHIPGRLHAREEDLARAATALSRRRCLVVAGPGDDPGLAPAIAALAAALEAPVIADCLSGLRAGGHDRSRVVAHGHLLAAAGLWDAGPPEVVLRVGALPTSKPVFTRLDDPAGPLQVVIEPGPRRDPGRGPRLVVRADPAGAVGALAAMVTAAPDGWGEAWHAADAAAAAGVAAALEEVGFPSEPGIVAALGRSLPAGATLWAASSMPVRDVDAYLPCRADPLRVLANRGANGIDGFLSTGFGSALADPAPTYLYAGDLSVVHDLDGLAAASRLRPDATVVVADNDGGGIFHFLPQAGLAEHFERHFGTPHGLDLAAVAAALGIPASRVTDPADLDRVLAAPPDGPRLVVVPVDRTRNVAVRAAFIDRVRDALRG